MEEGTVADALIVQAGRDGAAEVQFSAPNADPETLRTAAREATSRGKTKSGPTATRGLSFL